MGACASKFKRRKTADSAQTADRGDDDAIDAVEPLHMAPSMAEEVKMTSDGQVVLPGQKTPSPMKKSHEADNSEGAGRSSVGLHRKPSSCTGIKLTRAGTLCKYQIGSNSQIHGDSEDSQAQITRKTTMRINQSRANVAVPGTRSSSAAGARQDNVETLHEDDSDDADGADEDEYTVESSDEDEEASSSASSAASSGTEEDEDIEEELGDANLSPHRLHLQEDPQRAVDSFSQHGANWPDNALGEKNANPDTVLPFKEEDEGSFDTAAAAVGDMTADGGMHLFMGTSIEKDSADLLAPLPFTTAAAGAIKCDRPQSQLLPVSFWKKNELAYNKKHLVSGSIDSKVGAIVDPCTAGGGGVNRRGSVSGHNRVSIRINRQMSKRGSNSNDQPPATEKRSTENRFASLRKLNRFEKKDYKRRESVRRATLGTRKKDRERLLSKVSLGRKHRRTTLATSDAQRVSKVIEEEEEKRVHAAVRT